MSFYIYLHPIELLTQYVEYFHHLQKLPLCIFLVNPLLNQAQGLAGVPCPYRWVCLFQGSWNHRAGILLCQLRLLSNDLLMPIHSVYVPIFGSFSSLKSSPWSGYAPVCLFIRSLVSIWLVFSLGLLMHKAAVNVYIEVFG